MCGIIYAKSFDGSPVNKKVLEQYENQRTRGHEGFGLYDRNSKHLVKTPSEQKIIKYIKNKGRETSDLLFHHRLPTSTKNVTNACHPFSTKKFFMQKGFSGTEYILVHNGMVSNDKVLKKEHEALGIEYSSQQEDGHFNDSEAILWDFALYMEGVKDKFEPSGSIAFICIARNEKNGDKLYFGRNSGNPLWYKHDDKGIFLSSTGEGKIAVFDTLYTLDLKTYQLTHKNFEILGGYNYTPNRRTVPIKSKATPNYSTPYTANSAADRAHRHNENRVKAAVNQAMARSEQMKLLEADTDCPVPDNYRESYFWDTDKQELWEKNDKGVWRLTYPSGNYQPEAESDTELLKQLKKSQEDSNKPFYDISEVLENSNLLKRKETDELRRKDVSTRLTDYLDYYQDIDKAFNKVLNDLAFLTDEYKAQLGNGADNRNLYYELDVTKSVSDILMAHKTMAVWTKFLNSSEESQEATPEEKDDFVKAVNNFKKKFNKKHVNRGNYVTQ